jgi:hypothetical protein
MNRKDEDESGSNLFEGTIQAFAQIDLQIWYMPSYTTLHYITLHTPL